MASKSTKQNKGGCERQHQGSSSLPLGGPQHLASWKMPNGYTLAGYSRAADATFFFVPELKLQLDLGGSSKKYHAESFFLSHSHLDHAIYLNSVQPAGFLNLNAETRNTLFAPQEIVPYVKKFMLAGQQLNDIRDIDSDWFSKDRVKFDILGVKSGDEYLVNKRLNLHVKVIQCTHGVPSVGFIFFEKRHKLKQEYLGLPGKEIAKLRQSGVEVQETNSVPLMAFLGDTTPKVFDDHPELFEAPVIITECSFLEEGQEQHATDSWHSHWKGLEPFVKNHPTTTFVFIHFSLRYKDEEIHAFFDKLKDQYPNIHPFV